MAAEMAAVMAAGMEAGSVEAMADVSAAESAAETAAGSAAEAEVMLGRSTFEGKANPKRKAAARPHRSPPARRARSTYIIISGSACSTGGVHSHSQTWSTTAQRQASVNTVSPIAATSLHFACRTPYSAALAV
jgi:hypothetical protein